MTYYRTTITANADIASLVSGNINGVTRDYLVTNINTKNN